MSEQERDDVIWSGMWTCSTCGRETSVGYIGKPGTVVSDNDKAAKMREAENDHRPYCSGKREVEPWRSLGLLCPVSQ